MTLSESHDTLQHQLKSKPEPVGHDEVAAEARDAYIMHAASTPKKVWLRSPALLTTLVLELGVAVVFTRFLGTFSKYPLLIAFQPVISAIAGNVGLQGSAINIRSLALGIFDSRNMREGVWPEIKASAALGVIMGIIAGAIACIWSLVTPYKDGGSPAVSGAVAFGFAIFLGMFCSIMLAGLSGSWGPMIITTIGYDPSALAGPLQTAVSDIIGGTLLLIVSAWVLANFGGDTRSCPGGSFGSCLNVCGDMGNITASAADWVQQAGQACFDNCVQLASVGVCST